MSWLSAGPNSCPRRQQPKAMSPRPACLPNSPPPRPHPRGSAGPSCSLASTTCCRCSVRGTHVKRGSRRRDEDPRVSHRSAGRLRLLHLEPGPPRNACIAWGEGLPTNPRPSRPRADRGTRAKRGSERSPHGDPRSVTGLRPRRARARPRTNAARRCPNSTSPCPTTSTPEASESGRPSAPPSSAFPPIQASRQRIPESRDASANLASATAHAPAPAVLVARCPCRPTSAIARLLPREPLWTPYPLAGGLRDADGRVAPVDRAVGHDVLHG